MTEISRRTFLAAAGAAAAAPALLFGRARAARYPIAFSTLGCPKWPWARILEQAAQMGYAAVELRGIQGQIDLTKVPEFTGARLAASRKDLEAAGVAVCNLGASARMHESDPAVRAAQLDEGRRYIDLARELGAPYVRVFGNNIPAGESKPAVLARVVEGLRALGEHAKGSGVAVIIESHGDFTDSATLLEVLQTVAMPDVGLLWDAHHTFVAGKEDPATTFKALGKYVRHTHLKDSRPADKGVQYVLPGTGVVPMRDTVNVLARGGYRGLYCFEWEKGWHAELEEPEVAFPLYAEFMRRCLSDAGVKATATA